MSAVLWMTFGWLARAQDLRQRDPKGKKSGCQTFNPAARCSTYASRIAAELAFESLKRGMAFVWGFVGLLSAMVLALISLRTCII